MTTETNPRDEILTACKRLTEERTMKAKNAKPETLSDILAEMRDEMAGVRFVSGDGAIGTLHKAQAELRALADRIEAATAPKPEKGNGRWWLDDIRRQYYADKHADPV